MITAKGVYPNYKIVKAIQLMRYPTNPKDLKQFFGMVNYLAKYCAQFNRTYILPTPHYITKNEFLITLTN